MFRCENLGCKNITRPNQPENKIVVERREKTYENVIRRGKNKGTVEITSGWEIVKEIRVCPDCYKILTGEIPRVFVPRKRPRFKKRFFQKGKKKDWINPRQQNKYNKRVVKTKDKEEVRKQPIVEVVNPYPIVKE